MELEDLLRACEIFRQDEGRASFFEKAVEIVDAYPVQAIILLMATWNRARFNYFSRSSDNVLRLERALEVTKPLFEEYKNRGLNIQNANFDEIEEGVKFIYKKFSEIPGIEYTGAAKVMCLLNQDLFVMWDRNIRDAYGVGDGPEDYVYFLKLMQEKVRGIRWSAAKTGRTLAKAIDEYNYVKFTLKAI